MYLGVDGGGSKTTMVLIDKSGRVVACQEEASAYHVEIGISGLRRTLHDGIFRLLAKAKLSADALDFAFFGLPAYGEDSGLIETLNKLPSALISRDKYRCDNDAVSGWAAALGCEDGINVVAGTGSIGYGEWRQVKTRCGGWGELFGDEGSAYWIASRALQAFSQMSDGRLARGPMYDLMRNELDLDNDLDICTVVFDRWKGSRREIARLSTMVCQSAQSGDSVAIGIFDLAGRELSKTVDAIRTKLGIEIGANIPVSYTGGVFKAGKLILQPLQDQLQELSPDFHLVAPKYQPAVGSALYAAKLSGFEFSEQAQQRLKVQSPPEPLA